MNKFERALKIAQIETAIAKERCKIYNFAIELLSEKGATLLAEGSSVMTQNGRVVVGGVSDWSVDEAKFINAAYEKIDTLNNKLNKIKYG